MEDTEIIRAFGILNRTFLSYITKSLEGHALSYSESVFMVNIGMKEGITQEEISSNLAIDKAAVARSVKSMQKMGYVNTVQSNLDRRAKELYLTDAGKEMYQLILQMNSRWMDYILQEFSQQEVKDFGRTIDRLGKRAKGYKL